MACLAFVSDHHRLRIATSVLRRELGTTPAGTSAAALVETATRLGFSAKGVKGPAEALPAVPLPAIAHCLVDGRLPHFVVLVAWRSNHARVMDPAVGRVERWPPARFLETWTGVLVILAPGADFQPGDRTVPPLRRLATLLKPHRHGLGQAVVGAAFMTLLGLATSIYVQKIIDAVIPDGNRQLLNLLSLGMVAILVLKLLLGVSQSLVSMRIAQRIDAALILSYYRHLLTLPQSFFDTMRVGEITSRVADVVKIRNFLNSSLLNLVLNPLILLFSFIALFFYSAKLALLSLALAPANAAIYWAVNRLNRACQRQLMERSADFESHLVESLNAHGVVRHFQLEAHVTLRTENRLVRLLKLSWRASFGGMACGTASTLVTSGYSIALLWIGTDLVLDASLSPGELMSCYTLSGYLTGPINGVISLNSTLQETFIATDRLFEIMDLEREADRGFIDFPPSCAPGIRFEHVTFRHIGRPAILDDVCLDFPAAKITALVGESGSGKSTLLALLHRLHEPAQGRIFIGPHDLRHFRLSSLRHHVAVVPQQTQLLSGTVLENLMPGQRSPDLERILRICRQVGVLDFIENLPQGFLTYLQENGRNLSGGQRQRITLARALYRDAPILLLDEPSSALDLESEGNLVRLLRELRDNGRTILIATHSRGLIDAADQIVDLSPGQRAVVSNATNAADAPRPPGPAETDRLLTSPQS